MHDHLKKISRLGSQSILPSTSFALAQQASSREHSKAFTKDDDDTTSLSQWKVLSHPKMTCVQIRCNKNRAYSDNFVRQTQTMITKSFVQTGSTWVWNHPWAFKRLICDANVYMQYNYQNPVVSPRPEVLKSEDGTWDHMDLWWRSTDKDYRQKYADLYVFSKLSTRLST